MLCNLDVNMPFPLFFMTRTVEERPTKELVYFSGETSVCKRNFTQTRGHLFGESSRLRPAVKAAFLDTVHSRYGDSNPVLLYRAQQR